MDWEQSSPQFELDKSGSASHQVYLHLREQIVRMALQPGTVLSRQDLSSYYGVSGTPVRDATLRLADERLVDIFPQHGTRVSAIDIDAARHAHFLRLSMETEIARKLCDEKDPDLIISLHGLIEKQRRCLDQQHVDGFVRADQEFHHRLFVAAHLEDLWMLMRAKSGNMDRLRRLHVPLNGKADSVLQEHADLVSAIQKGDAHAAEAVVRRHLSGTMSKLRALRERYPDLLIADAAAPSHLNVPVAS